MAWKHITFEQGRELGAIADDLSPQHRLPRVAKALAVLKDLDEPDAEFVSEDEIVVQMLAALAGIATPTIGLNV